MTEREDAAEAPMPPSGVGPSGPVAADRSFGGAFSVPGFAGSTASFAELAMTAPVPGRLPDLVTASADRSDSGWPADAVGKPSAGQGPAAQYPEAHAPEPKPGEAQPGEAHSEEARSGKGRSGSAQSGNAHPGARAPREPRSPGRQHERPDRLGPDRLGPDRLGRAPRLLPGPGQRAGPSGPEPQKPARLPRFGCGRRRR